MTDSDERPGGEWFESCDSGRELMRAIIDTHDRLERLGAKPGAEHWTTNDTKFGEIRGQIVERWAGQTGKELHLFPYRDDFVRRGWITYRKLSPDAKAAVRAWGGIGVGAAPLFSGS